jgi:hypothetical protein
LSLSGQFDPYLYGLNSAGYPVRINKLRWENGSFPRFLGTSTSYSYTINNDTFKKKKDTKKSGKNNTDNLPEKTESSSNMNQNTNNGKNDLNKTTETTEGGYEKITIPWSISINYSIRYGNSSVFDKSKMEYNMELTHNLSINGNISLTTNWKINASTSYDFKANQFTYTNLNVTRNLHCWTMTASIVPFGIYKSYNFRIGVNASMLQDLKYEKQSDYGSNNITWY